MINKMQVENMRIPSFWELCTILPSYCHLYVSTIKFASYNYLPELDNILHYKGCAVRFDQSPAQQELHQCSHTLAPNAPFKNNNKKNNNKSQPCQSQIGNKWDVNTGLRHITISLQHCRGIPSCVVFSTSELSCKRETAPSFSAS